MNHMVWTPEIHMVEGVEVRTGYDDYGWYASTAPDPNLLYVGTTEDDVLHKVLETFLARRKPRPERV